MIRIISEGDCLRLVVPLGHDIRTSIHRTFFEAVLGCRLVSDGYELRDLERPSQALSDIAEYLTHSAVQYQLDEVSARILARARRSADLLAEALAVGTQIHSQTIDAPQLAGFIRELLPHQWRPVNHLLAIPNAANFSVMGSGKTTVVLAAFTELRRRNDVDCLIVVGPASCFMPWEEEFVACLGRPPASLRLVGPVDSRPQLYEQAPTAELLLTTYHTAARDQQRLSAMLRTRKAMLVLDESHSIKGSGVLAEAVIRIAPDAERRVVLTGTPAPNSYDDLWTQFNFLWPEQRFLGSRVAFHAALSSPGGEHQAKQRLRPLFTRVRKSDLGLPAPRFRPIEVKLLPVQQRIYHALSVATLQELNLQPTDRAQLRLWRRAKMVRLLQAAVNPSLIADASIEFSLPPESSLEVPLLAVIREYARYEVPPKILAAVELTRRLVESGEQVIIWTHFVRNIEILLPFLAPFDALSLYGDVPRAEADDEAYNRELHIRRFKDLRDSCKVLVANPGAAAESISLHHVCHNAVYLDRTFNAGQFMQSRDRIHRVGLAGDELVTYHLLISKATIDQTVNTRLEAKEQRMLNLLDDPDIPVQDLPVSTDELSGSEDEEDLDFAAVIEHLRHVTQSL